MSCCCRRNWCDPRQEQEQEQAQAQLQAQLQAQAQKVKVSQEQEAEQESEQKSIFKEIGNNSVNIEIDNVSVAVAVLAWLGWLSGALDGGDIKSLMASFQTNR